MSRSAGASRRCDRLPAPSVRTSAPTGGVSRSATRAAACRSTRPRPWKPVTRHTHRRQGELADVQPKPDIRRQYWCWEARQRRGERLTAADIPRADRPVPALLPRLPPEAQVKSRSSDAMTSSPDGLVGARRSARTRIRSCACTPSCRVPFGRRFDIPYLRSSRRERPGPRLRVADGGRGLMELVAGPWPVPARAKPDIPTPLGGTGARSCHQNRERAARCPPAGRTRLNRPWRRSRCIRHVAGPHSRI
jgi:hypothetical protein